jgi:hypothetical protein
MDEIGPLLSGQSIASEPMENEAVGTTAASSVSGKNLESNFGSIIFALFAMLSLLVSVLKGIVPIYLVESAIWAGLAWYWYKKNLVGPRVNLAVVVVAVFVAAGEGVVVGLHAGGESYTYLKEGSVQFRVNARLGRTDRLWSTGWVPVSFDAPPEDLPADTMSSISLFSGTWQSGLYGATDKVCFDLQNDSNYVLRDVAVHVSIDPKPTDDPFGGLANTVNMKVENGGLLDRGAHDRFCGEAPSHLTSGAKWSYDSPTAKGWKQ